MTNNCLDMVIEARKKILIIASGKSPPAVNDRMKERREEEELKPGIKLARV